MTSLPRVGIALAAFKPDIEFFCEQLDSIKRQSYGNWFCCISLDSPLEDLRKDPRLSIYFDDPQFQFSENPGARGATQNFEYAAKQCLAASPEFLAFSDQDDIWHDDKLEKQVRTLQSKPAMSVVHCDMRVLKRFEAEFKLLEKTAWEIEKRGVHHVSPLDFMIRNIAAGAGMLLDANLMKRYGDIPADAYGHDHWIPQVASFYGGVYAMPEPLYQYRIHGNNIAGISEYQGFFTPSKSAKNLGVIRKCIVAFNVSRARCAHVQRVGLPATTVQKMITSSRLDLGLGYVVKASASILSDKTITRACLARAAGKVLSIFKRHITDYSAM